MIKVVGNSRIRENIHHHEALADTTTTTISIFEELR